MQLAENEKIENKNKNREKRKEKIYLLVLGIISSISFFANIWVRPADLMEARNFITAREMLQNDNYIIPTLNGFLRFEKPPLPTWLTAFVMNVAGNTVDEYLLRIPVALTGILFAFLLYYFVKFFTKNNFQSFITSFVGATTFMLIKVGNENTWDLYVYVFAFGAVLFFLKGMEKEKLKYFTASSIFTACSVMSKGPVGIYGLMIPFFISHIYVYGFSQYKRNAKKIIFYLVLSAVLSSLWAGVVYMKYPDYFLNVLKKEEGTWTSRHTESIIYYMDYFVYMGVWIFFSVMALAKNWVKERSKDKKFSKFAFLLNILIIVFLSIIKMKKKRYGIPIYMSSAIGVGTICFYYWNKAWDELKKSDVVLLTVQFAFMVFVSTGVPVIMFFKGYLENKISLFYMIIVLAVFSPFVFLSLKNLFCRNKSSTKFAVFGSGLLMLLVNVSSNWFFDKNFVMRKTEGSQYESIKTVRKNPPLLDIYSSNYEIEDVWRVGKQIKDFNIDINKNLPKEFLCFGKIPKEIAKNYMIESKKTYMKDDGHTVDIYHLKKSEE